MRNILRCPQFAFLICLATLAVPASAELSPQAMLDTCAATLGQNKRCSDVIEVRMGVDLPDKSGTRTETIRYRRDGDRHDVFRSVTSITDAQGKPRSLDSKAGTGQRAIIDGWFLSYDIVVPSPPGSQGPPLVVKMASFTEKAKPEELSYLISQLCDAIFFYGYFEGDQKTFPEVMRNSGSLRLHEAKETVGGQPCDVLEAVNERGHYTVWLDPACGYLPRKALVQRGDNDRYYSILLSQHGGRDPKTLKPRNVKTLSWTADDVALQQVGGQWQITSAHCYLTKHYNEGSIVAGWETDQRKPMGENSDFGDAFKPSLPEETRISNQTQPQISFVWKGGKVVPAVDQPAVDAIGKSMEQLRSKKGVSTTQDVKGGQAK
jgi:hypothetical protein